MRFYILIAMLIGAIFFQGTIMGFFEIFGVTPNLLLIIVVYNAFLNGSKEGALLGLLGGLFADLAIGSYIGMNALTMMLGGYLVGLMETKLYQDSRIIVFFLVGFTSFITQLLNYLILNIFGVNIGFYGVLFEVIIPTAVYTAVIAAVFYKKFHQSSTVGNLSSEKI